MEELFGRQFELIKELGFTEWISRYPVNPLSLVVFILLAGIAVLIINAKIKKAAAEKNKPDGAALVLLKPRINSNKNLAENVRVISINGKKAAWFFFQTIPAVYLPPGNTCIEVYAEWAQKGGGLVKICKTESKTLELTIKPEVRYSLYYELDSSRYVLTEEELL